MCVVCGVYHIKIGSIRVSVADNDNEKKSHTSYIRTWTYGFLC